MFSNKAAPRNLPKNKSFTALSGAKLRPICYSLSVSKRLIGPFAGLPYGAFFFAPFNGIEGEF